MCISKKNFKRQTPLVINFLVHSRKTDQQMLQDMLNVKITNSKYYKSVEILGKNE